MSGSGKMVEENKKLVLSLPPFEEFGLNAFIKKNNIEFLSLREAILQVIQLANHTINISSPFLDIERIPEIRDELLSKAYSGVKIKILVRESFREDDSTRMNSIQSFLKRAKKANALENISIRDYHYGKNPYVNSSTHAKFVIADGKYMYLGSGELRKNSIDKNFEAGLLSSGKEVEDLEKIFLELFKKSEDLSC